VRYSRSEPVTANAATCSRSNSDGDHTELAAIAPHARVLAHYCVQAVAGRPALPEAAHTLPRASADGTAQRE
jgi:hypothetical protein